MIDFFAQQAHYLEHLAPIWLELDLAERGAFHVRDALNVRAHELGITTAGPLPDDPTTQLTVVASYGDLRTVRAHGRRCVLAEHGAGQSYIGTENGSYLGAPDRAGCVAILAPGELQAHVHRRAHPTIPAYVVGTPKLDRWHRDPPRPAGQTVAVSFHYDCRVVDETRSAALVYKDALGPLSRTFDVIGHAHPRGVVATRPIFAKHHIPFVPNFDEVMERASLYVCDNSSTLFEFASTGRPVVVLNISTYRRHVHHGMRFWEYADLGLQVNTPSELLATVGEALTDPPAVAARRAEIIGEVYAHIDGNAAKRAAEALRDVMDRWEG